MCLFDNNEEQPEPENISEDDAAVNQAEECPKNDEPTQSFVYGQLIRAYNQINNICDYIDDVNNERFQDEFNEYNKNKTATETPSIIYNYIPTWLSETYNDICEGIENYYDL